MMKILIATDGSDYSKAAIYMLANVVANPETAAFKIVSAVEFSTMLPSNGFIPISAGYYNDLQRSLREQATLSVKQAETEIRSLFPGGLLDVTTEVLDGSPPRVIVETAENWEADLIVIGSHGYGFWSRVMLGSVSNSVMHHAPCSVLVVRTLPA
jgi:nucleotide-binding universal stress UspA family protein